MEDFSNLKPTKRKFIPSFDSVFGDHKRLKNDFHQEKIIEPPKYPLGWNKRAELHSKATTSSNEREIIMNSINYPNTQKQIIEKPSKNPEKLPRVKCKVKVFKKNFESDSSTNASICSQSNPSRPYTLPNQFNVHKSNKIPTVPEPFNLSSDNRAKSYDNPKQNYGFVAKAMPDFSVPFFVKPCDKPCTKTLDVLLSTDERADKREIFNEKIKKKERDEEIRTRYENLEKEKREQEEIKAIRKYMEFKATAFVNNNVFVPKPSQIPLTVPQPPQLLTETRAYYRAYNN
jgi:Targeting protein for Xklp2 (TPX2) domain